MQGISLLIKTEGNEIMNGFEVKDTSKMMEKDAFFYYSIANP